MGQSFKRLGDEAEKSGLIMEKAAADALKKIEISIDNFKKRAIIAVGEIISPAGDYAGIKKWGALLLAEIAKGKDVFLNGMLKAWEVVAGSIFGTIGYAGDKLKEGFSAIGLLIKAEWGDAINVIIEKFNAIFGRGDFKLGLIDSDTAKKELAKIGTETGKAFSQYIKEGQEATAAAFEFDSSEQVAALQEIAGTYDGILSNSNAVADSQERMTKASKGTAAAQSKISKEKQMQLDLAHAMAAGDKMEIAAIQDKIALEDRIAQLQKLGVKNREQAEKMALQELWHAKEMERAQEDLIDAQITGNDKLILEEEKRLDLLKDIDRIMKETGKNYDDAVVAAEKLAAIKFGPDINQSGFVTRKEQREFDKLQKQKDRDRRMMEQLEKKEERERKQKMGVEERAREAKKKREELADPDRWLNPWERLQKKQNEVEQQFEDKKLQREKRARDQWEKLGIGEDKKRKDAIDKWKKEGGPQLFDVDGRPLGPDGKPIPGAKPVPGAPGAEPPKPQKPKAPEDRVWDKFKPTLDKMEGHLKNINKSLKCED